MSYTSEPLTSGWSTPQAIYKLTVPSDGYSYSFHAYPNYDSTGKVIPLSWSTTSNSQSYSIAMANLTFS
jgi:hypothetical protein